MATKYLYLEYLYNVIIPEFNVENVGIRRMDGGNIFCLRGSIEGSKCNLDEQCRCPVQYTFEMNKDGVFNHIDGLSLGRTFTFDNKKGLILHISTNSISSSETCR